MGRSNFYSGAGLDRADHLRVDQGWLADRLAHPETRLVAVWRSKSLVAVGQEARPLWLRRDQASALVEAAEATIFLGLNGERAYVALDVSAMEAPESDAAIAGRGQFRDLREVGPLLEPGAAAILAYARGLAHWHARHGFCGVCGSPTEIRNGGHLRVCGDAACGAQHFPRTDPAVIMLVHDGGRCVLGRQRIWLPGMHSTLAGFVEPGESLEESVAREVKEEVGLALDVARITYHSSQPWPFPASLMLGFHAHSEFLPLAVNEAELESARWFSREELLDSPEDESFRLPRRDSIARRLIEDWLTTG